jgi:NAD(P)-dependent dehydrogenase (short-subunit alcohol dehydrogenase family)
VTLTGKRALVTGAGRGIATVVAERGADVVVNDVDRDHAEALAG